MSSTALGILPFCRYLSLQSPKLFANFAYAYRAKAAFNCEEKIKLYLELERSDFSTDIIVFQLCDFQGIIQSVNVLVS